MNYKIRKIEPEEVSAALALVWEVFLEFEAPDYEQKGTQTFQKDIVHNAAFAENCKNGLCPFYGAFDGGKLIGVMCMQSNGTHITLNFVRKEYHRQGVATALFRRLLNERLRETPSLTEITVNSSPYGRGFYLRSGFVPTQGEQTTNGVRYTPMKYTVAKNDIPSPCGAVCAECEKLGEQCAGCRAIAGRVWWLAYTGQALCPFYRCCIEEHQFMHCGQCEDFPCELFQEGDPTKSDAENAEILKRQIAALKGEER